jgi:hypothetical protein
MNNNNVMRRIKGWIAGAVVITSVLMMFVGVPQ